jgi:hypothetical protein
MSGLAGSAPACCGSSLVRIQHIFKKSSVGDMPGQDIQATKNNIPKN